MQHHRGADPTLKNELFLFSKTKGGTEKPKSRTLKLNSVNNSKTVSIMPNWTGKSVIFIQACCSSDLSQKVTVTGPGLDQPLTATSNPAWSLPPSVQRNGFQFLNYQIPVNLDPSTAPWTYNVTIEYYNSQGVLTPSSALDASGTYVGNYVTMSMVVSNDDQSDDDYNDCVVQIFGFGNSND